MLATVWSRDEWNLYNLDPPQAGAHSSIAEAINDSGAVVGTYRDANLVRHGYLRQPDGTFISFDDPEAAQLPLSTTDDGTIPAASTRTESCGFLPTRTAFATAPSGSNSRLAWQNNRTRTTMCSRQTHSRAPQDSKRRGHS